MRALLTAIRTLTIIPLPGRDTDHFARSLTYFPAGGLVLGLAGWLCFKLGFLLNAAHAGAFTVLGLALVTLLTGGLHLDGLADSADALGNPRPPEKVLAILKDSRVGAFGVIAIVIGLLLKATLWQECVNVNESGIIVVSLIASRTAQGIVLSSYPYARSTSIAGSFAGEGAIKFALIGLPLGFALAWLFASWVLSLIALLICLSVGLLFGFYCKQRVGGITGDFVGCASELGELATLFLVFAVS